MTGFGNTPAFMFFSSCFKVGFSPMAKVVAVMNLDSIVEGLRALSGLLVLVKSAAQNEDEWKLVLNHKDITHVVALFFHCTLIGAVVNPR